MLQGIFRRLEVVRILVIHRPTIPQGVSIVISTGAHPYACAPRRIGRLGYQGPAPSLKTTARTWAIPMSKMVTALNFLSGPKGVQTGVVTSLRALITRTLNSPTVYSGNKTKMNHPNDVK